MSHTKVKTRIQNKHDLEANWKRASFVPFAGELIVYDVEVDKNGNTLELPTDRTTPYTYERFKIGDGIKQINDLPFIVEEITSAEITSLFQELFPEEFPSAQAEPTVLLADENTYEGWLTHEGI